jgi:hypothetical protein
LLGMSVVTGVASAFINRASIDRVFDLEHWQENKWTCCGKYF